ncbi:WGxxGxxG family protein [Brevibacillus borstelensis]|nr:WGxxGxxG family protein [Brevibacillus borstelensis]
MGLTANAETGGTGNVGGTNAPGNMTGAGGPGNAGVNNVNQGTYRTAAADNDTDWGWIGLLGLAGLAGLMGRNRNREPQR